MREWISAAPGVFGPLWCLLCDIRGIKPTHEREKGRTDDKIHSVFFELLTMVRISNRKWLVHWAMIQNITLFARGVGRAAESAVSYFGIALSNTSRRRLFDKISGNDKEGQAQKKTLRDRRCCMFRTCAALIFAYDNYQKGLSLQHQRGKHSSAFFKGTHECAHKVLPFTDCTFNEMYAMFTQHDQDIPSPWRMPAFEVVETEKQADLFAEYEQFESIITPDFSGNRVRAYLTLKNTSMCLRYLSLAFPPESDS